MFRRVILVVPFLFLAGCWHAQIHTGRPASPQVVERPWAHSFIAGLVPPDAMNVASECPAGVSRVETRHSFLNVLAHAVTWGIYSPMHLTVVCAASEDAQQALGSTPDAEEDERLGPRIDRLHEVSPVPPGPPSGDR